MSKFLHDADDDARAMTILPTFSAKTAEQQIRRLQKRNLFITCKAMHFSYDVIEIDVNVIFGDRSSFVFYVYFMLSIHVVSFWSMQGLFLARF